MFYKLYQVTIPIKYKRYENKNKERQMITLQRWDLGDSTQSGKNEKINKLNKEKRQGKWIIHEQHGEINK